MGSNDAFFSGMSRIHKILGDDEPALSKERQELPVPKPPAEEEIIEIDPVNPKDFELLALVDAKREMEAELRRRANKLLLWNVAIFLILVTVFLGFWLRGSFQ